MIGILGIVCLVVALLDLRTQFMGDISTVGLSDIIWPNNPYAYYRFWAEGPTDADIIFYYSFALLMSLICIVDLCLWLLTAIKTPYGVLTGRNLIMRKLSPKHEGMNNSRGPRLSAYVFKIFLKNREDLKNQLNV